MNSLLNLPDGASGVLQGTQLSLKNSYCEINSAHQKMFGASWNDVWLVITASFSLPEWLAVKMTFFAPWEGCSPDHGSFPIWFISVISTGFVSFWVRHVDFLKEMSITHQCVLATWYTWKYKQTIHSWLDATQGCINVCFLLDVLYYITGNFFTTRQVLQVDKKWNKNSKVLYMLWLNKFLVSMLFSIVFR